MNINKVTPKSLTGNVWPALSGPQAASLLAMQFQFEQTERLVPATLRDAQFEQLAVVLRHAYDTIPFHKNRLSAIGYQPRHTLSEEIFSRIPFLQRSDIQSNGKALLSNRPPVSHGRIAKGITSGSTGRPIEYYGTELSHFFWQALTLREHIWHNRNIDGKLAAIRTGLKNTVAPTWGPPADIVFVTGPCATLDIRTDVEAQLDWLLEHDPKYLLTYPTNVRALAQASLLRGLSLDSLCEVRTLGEMVDQEVRDLCREAWGVKLVDIYSSREVGYLALQCPDHEHYHAQAENLFLEVLDSDDRPCTAGQVGRIVVSTLNNFAMPLVRYETYDYAEVGAPCSCGRGLPVLKRILGRKRNMVTFPNGHRHWPSTGYKEWSVKLPIVQAQIIQRSLTAIEARLVPSRPLTHAEELEFITILHRSLGYPFEITMSYLQELPRSAGGKFEDFISEVTTPATGNQSCVG